MDVRDYSCFSDLIKAIRREHHLSQRALAKTLQVSPGYVGQWELQLTQPSPAVTVKLCRAFTIDDIEYVQRLAYASRAPEWLRESIIRYERDPTQSPPLSLVERQILDTMRRLPEAQRERIAERIVGWVDAIESELEAPPQRSRSAG